MSSRAMKSLMMVLMDGDDLSSCFCYCCCAIRIICHNNNRLHASTSTSDNSNLSYSKTTAFKRCRFDLRHRLRSLESMRSWSNQEKTIILTLKCFNGNDRSLTLLIWLAWCYFNSHFGWGGKFKLQLWLIGALLRPPSFWGTVTDSSKKIRTVTPMCRRWKHFCRIFQDVGGQNYWRLFFKLYNMLWYCPNGYRAN